MERVALACWDDFEAQLKKLDEEANAVEDARGDVRASGYLFRGHGDADYPLQTSLERFFAKPLSLADYYRLALVAKPRLEAFTGRRWELPSQEAYAAWLEGAAGSTLDDYPAYDYLAYLRHHGFPSPLLDWTQSPYVAAFFAFRYPLPGAKAVAVYAYRDAPDAKTASSGAARIHRQGPYVSSDKRHFLQQSQYTFCTRTDDAGVVRYIGHEQAFRDVSPADRIRKFLIPLSARRQALMQLNRMNINAFSLFGSEDSLVETIAISDIYLRGGDL